MLVTIATAALGQGRYMLDWPAWLHAAGAALTLAVNGWVWRQEYRNMRGNMRILERCTPRWTACGRSRVAEQRGGAATGAGIAMLARPVGRRKAFREGWQCAYESGYDCI